MKVTPFDVRRKEFRRSVRGYLDEDVDVFLDTVADELERVAKANKELEAKVRALEEEVAGHAHIREALEKTLVAAQLQSEEIRTKAQKESQSMLREAEKKAKTVVDDFYAQTQAVQQTLMQLKLLEEDFRFKFKGLLEAYMKLLEEGPVLVPVPEVGEVGSRSAGEAGSDSAAAAVGAEGVSPGDGDDKPEPAPASAPVTKEVAESPSADPVSSAALPPSLPKTAVAAEPSGGTDDDQTVELKSSGGPPEGAIHFGVREEDLDDPFPEIGGDRAQPRDFAW